jgi:hypothetical protein
MLDQVDNDLGSYDFKELHRYLHFLIPKSSLIKFHNLVRIRDDVFSDDKIDVNEEEDDDVEFLGEEIAPDLLIDHIGVEVPPLQPDNQVRDQWDQRVDQGQANRWDERRNVGEPLEFLLEVSGDVILVHIDKEDGVPAGQNQSKVK